MPKASDRRLIRSPFPIDQSPPTVTTPSSEAPGTRGENNHALADVVTNKQPALISGPPNKQSPLADVETRKNPAARPAPSQNRGVFPLNPSVQSPGMPYNPPPASAPLYNPNNLPTASASSHNPNNLPPASSPLHNPNASILSRKKRRAPRSKRQKIQLLVVTILWLLPSLLVIFELISAFVIYKQMQDGIAHLQAAQSVFHANSGSSLANYFDTSKLQQAQTQVDAAQTDFAELSDKLDHDGFISLASNLLPAQVSTARSLGHIATTGMVVAQQLLKTVQTIAPSVAPALQKSSTASSSQNAPLTPFITPASYQEINTTLETITPLVHQMAGDAQGLSLTSLPISSKQRATLASIIPLLPVLDAALPQIHNTQDALGWFLGIGGQRSFLLEPMDSAELRATGGFTGQFGDLTLNGGHMGPLKLSNIGKYEEDHTAEGSPPDPTVYPKVIGQSAPKPYSNWWPIGNFGMRDANLSADFPTSANIIMDRYKYEFGTSLDGVIVFTPALIQHILHVTGPISIPLYHQVITEQNLEDLLHYYQLDNTGIRQEEIVEHVSDNQIARKLFTQRVTQALMTTVTHLPLNKMLSMANEIISSMKSKDLQIYVTNPQLEALLGKYGSTASLDRSTSHDGLFVVQENLSASKAAQYVTTSIQDAIALDGAGGATHQMQITLDYQQKGDVYGFDTYRDYMRVYVPVNSQLLKGNGFDQYDKPYCGDEKSGYTLCQADVYSDGSLVCATPVEIGYATSYLNDPYLGKDHPLDLIGPPQNLQSDEAGRAMFGGWVVIPKNCTMKVTLSWYVPPQGTQPYSLLLQSQASVYAPLDLTIHPSAKMCAQNLHFSQRMDGTDLSFTIKQQGAQCTLVSQ
ncbi:MAG TPA: DUF4012 domain-containing protein [Ktedonobacteraceae bacterium]